MSGKKKKDNWQSCELCGRLLYHRHLSDHRVSCETGPPFDCIKHPFIQDGCLHAIALERNNIMVASKMKIIFEFSNPHFSLKRAPLFLENLEEVRQN